MDELRIDPETWVALAIIVLVFLGLLWGLFRLIARLFRALFSKLRREPQPEDPPVRPMPAHPARPQPSATGSAAATDAAPDLAAAAAPDGDDDPGTPGDDPAEPSTRIAPPVELSEEPPTTIHPSAPPDPGQAAAPAPSPPPRRPFTRDQVRQDHGAEVQDLDSGSEDLPNFFGELETLFRRTLAAKPEEVDTRLKLLEICHAVGDTDKFMTEAMTIRELLKGDSDQRWESVQRLGSSILPSHPLFAAEDSGAGVAGQPMKKIGRHYDALNHDKAHPVLSRLKAQFQAMHSPDGEGGLLQELLGLLGEPSPLKPVPRDDDESGAAILVKREERAIFEPIYLNARAQILIARRLNCRRIVTAARSEAHARAIAHGVTRIEGGMKARLYFDDRLVALDEGLAAELSSDSVEVLLPPFNRVGDDGEPLDVRVLALEDYINSNGGMMYVSDLGGGPAPYAQIIRDCQSAIGHAARKQFEALGINVPSAMVCCYESGQVALGLFQPYLKEEGCAMYCATQFSEHRNTGSADTRIGVELRSAREHAWLRAAGRVEYQEIDDNAAAEALHKYPELLTGDNALENGRAMVLARRLAAELPDGDTVILLLAPSERLGGEAFRSIEDATPV